jgi:hypothetical protein
MHVVPGWNIVMIAQQPVSLKHGHGQVDIDGAAVPPHFYWHDVTVLSELEGHTAEDTVASENDTAIAPDREGPHLEEDVIGT